MDENINSASDQNAQTTTEDEGKPAEDISDTKLDPCKVPEDAMTNPLDGSGDSTMSHDIDSGNSIIGTEKATTSDTDNSELSLIQEKASNIPKHLKNDIDPNSEDLELKWDEDDDNVIDEDTPGLIENLKLDITDDKADKDAGDNVDAKAHKINDIHPIRDPVLVDLMITDSEINEVVTEKAVPSNVNVSEKMEIDDSDVVNESCTGSVAPSSTTENTETKETQESMKIKLSTPESFCDEESIEKNSIIKESDNTNEDETKVMSEDMENVLIKDKTSESPDKLETSQVEDISEQITADSTNLQEEPTETNVESTKIYKEQTQITTELPAISISDDSATIATEIPSIEIKAESITEVALPEPVVEINKVADLEDMENVAIKDKTSESPDKPETSQVEDIAEEMTADSTNLQEEPTETNVESTDIYKEPTQIAIVLPAISISDGSSTITTEIPSIEIKAEANTEIALIEPVAEINKIADVTDLQEELPAESVKEEVSDTLENTVTKDTITQAEQVESIEDFIANMPVLSEDSRTNDIFSKDDVTEFLEDKVTALSATDKDLNEKQETSMETDVEMSDKQITVLEDVSEANQQITVKDEPISAAEAIETPDETVFLPVVDQVKTEVSEMPSTSQAEDMVPDDDDFVSMTDSLGLLSESTRMIEEEDEPDDENDDDGDDEEDADDDQDDADEESNLRQPDLSEDSNQITAEQSEDSNAPVSETDISKGEGSHENTSDGFVVKPDDAKELIETPAKKDQVLESGVIMMVYSDSAKDSKDEEKSMDVDVDGDVARQDQKTPEKQIIASKETAVPPNRPHIADELVTAVAEDTVDDELEKDVGPVEEDLQDTKNNSEPILASAPEEAKVSEVIEDKEQSGEVSKGESEVSKPLSVPEKLRSVENIIDLEESSEDELQEILKDSPAPSSPIEVKTDPSGETLTSVNIPAGIDIMSASSGASSIVSDQGEVVVQGLPKPQPIKKTRLNTSEISIKTANTTAEPLVIPETKIEDLSKAQEKPTEKFGLEIFSLDSDDEDSYDGFDNRVKSPSPIRRLSSRCVNPLCPNDNEEVKRFPADAMVLRYYEVKRRRAIVCECCAEFVCARAWQLMEGFKGLAPLLSLDISKPVLELVEIVDSDSDGGGDRGDGGELETGRGPGLQADRLLELEEQLEEIINKTWTDCNLSERLIEAKEDIEGQLDFLEKKRKEVEAMFDGCQLANDNLRSDLYGCFAPTTKVLPGLEIYDTPERQFTGVVQETEQQEQEIRRSKRPRPPMIEAPAAYAPAAKRQAIPLGFKENQESKDDDSISVVKLSAEAAPASLPPAGMLTKPPLKVGDLLLARRETSGTWLRATVLEVLPKGSSQFTTCRVRFENKSKLVVTLTARHLAYSDPANVRLVIGTRVIALFIDTANTLKRRMFYSGIIAEMPNPVNNYRYLIFFDIGYAQYVTHADSRVVCECSRLVWEEVQPLSREFVRQYLVNYPERPMVRLHAGQSLKTEWNGKWWVSKVMKVDASLVQVHFEADDRTEWIYRGSTRLAPLYLELQAAERPRPRHSTANKRNQQNMPYVEYTRSDEAADLAQKTEEQIKLHNEELRRQRAVAKKSTAAPLQPHSVSYPQPLDSVMSRVVYYTPKAAVKPYKMVTHTCTERCRRTDVLPLKELRTYNPLARPLLSGWERQIVRYKGRKEVMYRAPCGRRLRTMPELHRYLTATQSEMGVDLFDFNAMTHCLAEFLLNRCRVTKKDLSHGKENVPVPCVNYYDNSLPEMCLYNTERTPTAGVPLNLDGAFLCGCDCEDDCQDKSKCQCWQLTIEGARTIGMDEDEVGYEFKRLPEPVPTGIYECNSRCKCKQTCLNRVAQHPLQLKLQVFKTQNRGWGIRALNDVPKGAFLCVYAGNLLTDATANLDGLNEGDEYLAELDYIEVVEQMKEGFEEDVPAKDKILDKKEGSSGNEEEESSSSEEEERPSKNEVADDDFKPDYIPMTAPFKKSLRKRDKKKKEEAKEESAETRKERSEDDCIMISDDDEVKEPSNFTAQAGMAEGDLSPKTKSVRSHFGKDEACYIMDAKVQGNIGRYLNHSCMPNVFVQNVFVDTHDLRFPWVAFFALSHVRAGTELTWNYNYDVGSVPGKVLKCFCGAPNCRGRLL